MTIELIEFGQVDELKKIGIMYPNTVCQLQWMFRRRHENGLAEAFAEVGGRKLFKPKKYLEIISR